MADAAVRRAFALAAGVAALACAPPATRPPAPDAADHAVRVALRTAAPAVTISATSSWRVFTDRGVLITSGAGGETFAASTVSGAIIVTRSGAGELRHREAVTVRPVERNAFVTLDGRRYRGELTLYSGDGGLVVVNRLPLEEYLRGVVPLEIGPRRPDERGAVEAQAVAARSYALVRLRPGAGTRYDLLATVMHQAYGGADVEIAIADAAIRATRGLVLTYGGRIVDAVYHSTCGGTTAAASEVWRSEDLPYLRPVSDRIPGTDRHYCDISPRFRWTSEFTRDELSGLLARYLRDYAHVGAEGPGVPLRVEAEGRTPGGRVRALVFTTDRGRYTVRGNDMRFVLRDSGGAILGSTYFSLDNDTRSGVLTRIQLLGAGFGHGIGMCQWGAIGRARAGQDFRTILGTYYPGTRVEMVNQRRD